MTIGVSPGQGYLVGDLQNGVQAAVASDSAARRLQRHLRWSGQQGGSAFGDLARAMGMAVLLMYMLMMMLFGSLTLPLAVLDVAAAGADRRAGRAWRWPTAPFTLFSMLGVAVLLGLVGKNAILLVDRTDRLRHSGLDRYHGAAARRARAACGRS